MKEPKDKIIDLDTARDNIFKAVSPLESEVVSLRNSLSRVVATAVNAAHNLPEFDCSIRDGFVLRGQGKYVDRDIYSFPVQGEIAAGSTKDIVIQSDTAWRIMTGARIPQGGERVVMQEDCIEAENFVQISEDVLHRKSSFIRNRGCEYRSGQEVMLAGEEVHPGHLVRLAGTGCEKIQVFKRPSVHFFCTGSELVGQDEERKKGQKVSGNMFLLEGLIDQAGGLATNCGVVADEFHDVVDVIASIKSKAVDVAISTGGMGPGKYDLVSRAFAEAGGEVIYNGLEMKPGRGTLCGLLGKTLFFALPGPPPAVEIIFNEMVVPALAYLQGKGTVYPVRYYARLASSFSVKVSKTVTVKGGVQFIDKGIVVIRTVKKDEIPNCYMLLPPDRANMDKDELVEIHRII